MQTSESTTPSSYELEAQLRELVARIAQRLAADVVTLYLYDADRDKFYLPIGWGLRDETTFQHAMPRSDRIAGKIVRSRQRVLAEDAKSHADMGGPFTFRERIETAAGFPILLGDKAEGVLFVNYRRPHRFNDQDLREIDACLQEASTLLANSRLAEARQALIPAAPAGVSNRLDFIIGSAYTFVDAPIALWVWDKEAQRLSLRVARGLRSEFVQSAAVSPVPDNVLGTVFLSRAAATFPNLEGEVSFPFPDELRHEGWKALRAEPIWSGGRVVGVLALFSFSGIAPWQSNLLSDLARQVGEVLLEQRYAQIVADLVDIGIALAGQLELAQVLHLIVDKAAEVFDADIVTLYPYSYKHREFGPPIARGVSADFYAHPAPSASGIAARIVKEGCAVFADDAEKDERMSSGFIVRQRVKSCAGFPLRVGDETLGVLFINYCTPYRFGQQDKDLLALFASQAAIAINNAHLFHEERQRVVMAEIANTFSETLDRKRTLQAIVEGAVQLTGASNSSLFLFDAKRERFELCARAPDISSTTASPRSTEGITRTILDLGEAILIPDTRDDPRVRPRVVQEGIRSILGVPVQVKGERVGVLYVNSVEPGRFDRNHLEFLQGLADYGAIAIERTRPLEAIAEVNKATTNILRLDDLIKELLSKIVSELHFDLAALQLVNRERGTIETVDGINAPWSAEAKHSLDSEDIQAYVVRTGKREVIAGPDKRFDPGIYRRYGHEHLVRAFLPLYTDEGQVFGTVEAGFDRRRRPDISPEELTALESLLAGYAPVLWQTTLSYTLKLIVESAVRMVRADSGSIHVLYDSGKKKYVYEACAGRIGPEFLEAFPPREHGIGHKSLLERRPMWIDDASELRQLPIYAPHRLLEKTFPDRYPQGQGIRAIASFPLVTGNEYGGKYEGVLYIHFWQEHAFSEYEINWLQLFADQVSVAIQNAIFYEKLRDRSQALSSLSMIGQTLISERVRLGRLLEMIAENALDVLKADIVTIYQYNQEENRFVTPPTMAGVLYAKGFMRTAVEEGDAPWEIVHKIGKSYYASNASGETIMCNRERERSAAKGERFVDREGIKSSAGIVLAVQGEIVGVMFINYRSHHDFPDSERSLIENFASYAAIAIRNARKLVQEDVSSWKRIREIDRKISSTLDLDKVLDLIVETSMRHVGGAADYGTLQLLEEESGELVVRAHRNLPPEIAELRLTLDAPGITPMVARERLPRLVPDTTAETDYVELVPGIRSEVAVPLLQEDRVVGVLNLESRTPQAFDDADVSFLDLLAGQAVVAIQNARYVEQLRQYVEQLRQLGKVLQAITSTTDLESVLQLIAESTLTVLGADDAVIFPYDPQTRKFLNQVVYRGRSAASPRPGVPRKGGLATRVLKKGLIAIDDLDAPGIDPGIVPKTGLLGELGTKAFVGVALRVHKETPLGVLYVDYQKRHHFSSQERDLIQAFADQTAIAIHNARNYEALRRAQEELQATQKRERATEMMATLGEIAGTLVHRMNNQIGAIRAIAEQIRRRFSDDEYVRSRTEIIESRASESLEMIRDMRKSLEDRQPGRINLNEAVQSAVQKTVIPGTITLSLQLTPGAPVVWANRGQLIEAIHNLLRNAVEAIGDAPGKIAVTTTLTPEHGATVQVSDSGKGMTPAVQERIFEPFFTTKPVGKGLGFGLWWIRTYVQRLGGDVEFTSIPEKGSIFVVKLPVCET